jgi:4-hydroxy-3-polyprenylbenzoate decarboxylase
MAERRSLIEYEDFRSYIDLLRQKGELKTVTTEVDPDQELAAVFIELAKRQNKAVLFENVKGSSLPVLIGATASKERICLSIGCQETDLDQFVKEILETKRDDFQPRVIKNAPSQEVIKTGKQVDLDRLPVPTFCENEGGPYITAGIALSIDPENGSRNAGIYRIMVRGTNELNINFGIPNRHLLKHALKAQKMGEKLPVAIVIGVEPAVWLCASIPFPGRFDEVAQAGAILRRPVDLVRAKTINIDVPARAEIILECEMDCDNLKPEGPYNDFQGYYTDVKDNFTLAVTAITHRENPIYETSMTGHVPEGEVEIWRHLSVRQQCIQLQKVVPQVTRLSFDAASRGHVYIVSVRNKKPFMAKQIGAAILSFAWSSIVKMVIVVDDDIDVEDPGQVMWAIATRVDFERDTELLSDLPGLGFDVSTGGRLRVSKLVLDATRKLEEEGYPGKFPEAGWPAQDVLESVRENWRKYELD